MILSGRQFREGRQLAGMTQADLAAAADVALSLIVRTEAVDGMPMIRKRDEIAMRSVLEAAGVEFIPENGGGAGVRLRKVEPPTV
ncbi:MAG: hypothetical protein ACRYGP_29975 [Janthinobacterium lividum]